MSDSTTRAATPSRGIFSAVVLLTIARTAINMTRRFTYTFVPEIARALGVGIGNVQTGITLQSGVAILSPLFGGISERYGRKYVLVVAQLIVAALGLIGAAAPTYGIFLAMMVGFGFGKMLFDPAALAYLGDRVPYHRRSAAIGFNEMSWGAALLAAAPLTGFLLERGTLHAVFLMLGVVNLIGALLIFLILPGDRPKGADVKPVPLLASWRAVSKSPSAIGLMLFAAMNAAANEMIFINYGTFMEQSFGLALSTLGVVTIAISIAEGFGEGAVAGIGDRLGPKRLTMIGAGLAAICYGLFPLFSSALPVAIVGIFAMFLGCEIAVVGAIPLYTEVLPKSRGAMVAATIGAIAIGRVVGGLLGAAIFNAAGVQLNSAVAFTVMCVGLLIFWRVVHIHVEREQ